MAASGSGGATALPETMLAFVAREVLKQRQEMANIHEQLRSVQRRQAERVAVSRRGFNWMKVLAGTAAAAATVVPIMAVAWGEWIRANPAVAATGFGSFVTVVLGVAGAAFRVRERRSTEKERAAEEEREAVASNDAH